MVRETSALLLLATFAAWPGCAHVPEVDPPDPALTAESLRRGGIANIGVVQPGEIIQPPGPLTDALEKVLTIMYPDVPVIRAARACAALDNSTARFLLLSFQVHGSAEAAWLARAADSLRALARYAALARVETNTLQYVTRPTPPHDPSVKAPPSDTSRVYREGNVPVTIREVFVRVHLYDLETRRLAISGSYFGSAVSAEGRHDASAAATSRATDALSHRNHWPSRWTSVPRNALQDGATRSRRRWRGRSSRRTSASFDPYPDGPNSVEAPFPLTRLRLHRFADGGVP